MSDILGGKAISLCTEGRVQPAEGRIFLVEGSAPEPYVVVFTGSRAVCTCPATGRCSHVAAARLYNRATPEMRKALDVRAEQRKAAV